MTLLVLAQSDGRPALAATGPTLAFAQTWARVTGGAFDLLLAGGPARDDPDEWRGFGARQVLVAGLPELTHPTADRMASVCRQAMVHAEATSAAGPSSRFGRDILPRVAALCDLPMVTDVMALERQEGSLRCRRLMYSGRLIAQVELSGDDAVYAVRAASWGKPEVSAAKSPVHRLEPGGLPQGTTWVGLDTGARSRPELTEARVVVAGGRPLGDAETFDRLLGTLADKLDGAVGATGGAVGAGLAPSDLQIGQTGKTVAPDLYIAAGISGSDQHVAGLRDSRVIVAINTDPAAPMFGIADYGLVADIHHALPELIEKL